MRQAKLFLFIFFSFAASRFVFSDITNNSSRHKGRVIIVDKLYSQTPVSNVSSVIDSNGTKVCDPGSVHYSVLIVTFPSLDIYYREIPDLTIYLRAQTSLQRSQHKYSFEQRLIHTHHRFLVLIWCTDYSRQFIIFTNILCAYNFNFLFSGKASSSSTVTTNIHDLGMLKKLYPFDSLPFKLLIIYWSQVVVLGLALVILEAPQGLSTSWTASTKLLSQSFSRNTFLKMVFTVPVFVFNVLIKWFVIPTLYGVNIFRRWEFRAPCVWSMEWVSVFGSS